MANKRATITGPWATDANGDNIPAIQDEWQDVYMWSNLRDTGQPSVPPDPNIGTWAVDSVPEEALDALEVSATYSFVILSEETL